MIKNSTTFVLVGDLVSELMYSFDFYALFLQVVN